MTKVFKREFTSLCRRIEMEKDIIAWLLKKHRKSWESFYFTLSLKNKIDIIVIVWIVLWMSFKDTRIHFVVPVWKQKKPLLHHWRVQSFLGRPVYISNPQRGHHGWQWVEKCSKYVTPDALKIHSLVLSVLICLCKTFF